MFSTGIEKMAEAEGKPFTFIPETILKKRKSTEAMALRRKEQLEQRKFGYKKNKHESIKKPEEFVKEFRAKVPCFRIWYVNGAQIPIGLTLVDN